MAIKKLSEETCNDYIEMLNKHGEEGLYRRAIGAGFLRLTKTDSPDLEILDYSDAFFALYRRTGEDVYFTIGKVLRRAAHAVYRELMRQNKSKKPNYQRFLNVVQT
ncbi:MAG TPA: hypothetical protein VM577_09100 [Anaerovoracaceae bacterium]|nr:hypothetical protein [Anaerovoracaceae bacterium]